ncbi:BAT2_1 [Sanghuangporus vaninii]
MVSPTPAFVSVPRTGLILRSIVHYLRLLRTALGLSGARIMQILKSLFPKLLSNPHVREILRFIFLGSVVELTRSASQKASDFFNNFFIVKATFTQGDFAFDWVKRYLEDQRIWEQSRIFHVGACSPALRKRKSAGLGEKVQSDKDFDDGHPHPVYQPTSLQPEFLRWRGYWITVYADLGTSSGYNDDNMYMLSLSVWSRNRKILDEFVQEARTHYLNSPLPPRELMTVPDPCGSLLTARINQGDSSYEWMMAFLRSQETTEDTMDLQVTTKQTDLYNPANRPSERPLVAFKAAPRGRQRLKFAGHWVQFDTDASTVPFGGIQYDGGYGGGAITITIHNSKRAVLEELIAAAREIYLKATVAQVTVHIANSYGSWTKTVTKNRRSLNTLILPEGVKEDLLRDAREFLQSEEWYVWAGVPHRRGYLLYGHPGTGKSSTIHALASELGLEMYYIQLSSDYMTDENLATLVSSTPPRCILLLEDIDCAFPSREDDDEATDRWGNPVIRTHSTVTLSGLLNILDSVTSEEGRITFATTNHIDRLDPALIREGRMDVKLEYKLANQYQIQETYLRFYEQRFVRSEEESSRDTEAKGPAPPRPSLMSMHIEKDDEPPLARDEVHELARRFAEAIPEDTFSLAQIQGYLLTKKVQPRGAAGGAAEWVKNRTEEKRKLEELKEKKRQKRRETQAARQAAAKFLHSPWSDVRGYLSFLDMVTSVANGHVVAKNGEPSLQQNGTGVSKLDASKLIINLTKSPKTLPDPSTLVFGQTFTDHMLVMSFDPKSGWSAPVLQPHQPLQIDPAASCLQYSTNLFEGMKAYLGPDGEVRLFRPNLNMERMKMSAARIALPPFDSDELLILIRKLISIEKRWIPALPGFSLYIRPTMIGTRSSLGVRASDSAMIYVICSPAGPYFGAGTKTISLYAVYETIRAWPGGTGGHKLGLNYSPGFEPTRRAAQRGYKQVLWLFGEDHRVTEAGAMNFFIVVKREDGDLDLITPPLDGTILPGVTRSSVLELAQVHSSETPLDGVPATQRLHVKERTLTMKDLQTFADAGTLLEAFCVGTAVIVAPVDKIGYEDKDIILPEQTPVANALHRRIVAIQEGRFEYKGWSVKCE